MNIGLRWSFCVFLAQRFMKMRQQPLAEPDKRVALRVEKLPAPRRGGGASPGPVPDRMACGRIGTVASG
jgi:hypothetical protein